MHAPRKETWQEKIKRSRYLVGALLFHAILFVLLATWVIFEAPPPPPTAEFQPVAVKTPPPPKQPPSTGGSAANPHYEPQPVVVPVVTPPSVITTATSSFTVDASKVLDQTLTHFSDKMAQGVGLTSGSGGNGGTGNGPFGTFKGTTTLLTGYLIDLKQTSDGQPSDLVKDNDPDSDKAQNAYYALLSKYIKEGWDDSLLAPYYKSKVPLYTDAIAISTRASEAAPTAFGLENEVQPGLWVVHYHVKMEAPQPGDYRLAGFGDNVLVVRINGATVLDGGWSPVTTQSDLNQPLPYVLPTYVQYAGDGNGAHLKIGPSFHIDTATQVDMDVLIGDSGGICSFFLLIEKVGNTYEKQADGTPILPFFQLGSKAAPTFQDGEEHPPYSTTPEPWQGVPN